jgi:hypothetical protein
MRIAGISPIVVKFVAVGRQFKIARSQSVNPSGVISVIGIDILKMLKRWRIDALRW